MASADEIVALIMALPPVPFAQLSAEGDWLSLACDGRTLARLTVEATDRPTTWSATQAVNALAHQALFTSGLELLPAGESVNSAHQVIEWWDAAVCAISALSRRSSV